MKKHKSKKPQINKLKYPLWQQLSFYVLTLLAPIIVIVIQGLKSPHPVFRITFTVLCIILLLWSFARKFILSGIEKNMKAKKANLEHDYEIEVGNLQKIKYLWFNNELWLSVINAIQVILIGSIILLLLVGIESASIKIKGATLLIATCYLIAYILKFIVILCLREKEYKNKGEVENERGKQK